MLGCARFTALAGLAVLLLACPGTAGQRSTPGGSPSSPFPIASFGALPSRGSAPLSVRFVDRSYGEITSWSWDFGDGSTSQLSSPTHVYAEDGSYPVRLTVRGPGGADTMTKPGGVVVQSCTVSSARANRSYPLERGEDFVPITGDDSLGFYVVYSGKAVSSTNTAIANNVGLFLFPLADGEVLLFGAGYGDANWMVEPTGDAAFDAQRVDGLLRSCLGRRPAETRLRFVAPHGHIDHINADFVRELRRRGYEIVDIAYHSADAAAVRYLPGWTAQDRALFRALPGTQECQEELLSFPSPLGKIWFYSRPGHTNGSIDLVIDVANDPTNRVIVRGSGASYGSCPIPGTREAVEPHGNVVLDATPPGLSSLAPAEGSALGDTLVSVFGQGFAAAGAGLPEVRFDGAPASAVTVLDGGALTCRVPPGLAGSSPRVEVLTRNGNAALEQAFSYRPLPTLTSIAPAHGPASGGTLVTLRGTGFQAHASGTSTVTFGGGTATLVTVIDDTTLSCRTPAASPGPATVLLRNPDGEARLAGGFLFSPPIDVSGVNPPYGSALGGTRVVILGRYFAAGAELPRIFLGAEAATDVVRASDTRLECTTPPGPAGAQVDVRVSGENGGDTLVQGYRYFPAPRLDSVSPADGPALGGLEVTLGGSGFSRNNAGPCGVTFAGRAASGVLVLSDTALRCLAPAGPGGSAVDVVVSNGNGGGRLAGGFRYRRPPSVAGVEPSRGTHFGSTSVVLRGSGFLEPGAGLHTVTFGGLPASDVSVLDDANLACRTPAGALGVAVEVAVGNANGESRLPEGFRYAAQPRVLSLTPEAGPSRGGTLVTLRGSDFQAAGAGETLVRLGGTRVDARVVDDGTIQLRTPLGFPGRSADLLLVNENGRCELAGAFTYHELPTLTHVQPGSGPIAGATPVLVRGSGFLAAGPAARVSFGASAARDVRVLDDTRLTCETPGGAAGAVSVTLAGASGVATLLDGFVYGSTRPVLRSVEPANGPGNGGTPVTILGSGFAASSAGANAVRFGAQPATGVRVVDDSRLACLAPDGPPGTSVDVEVENTNGSARLAGAYRYHRGPSLLAASPDHGPGAGGELVTLRGSGFRDDQPGSNAVRFGGVSASELELLDDATLRCRAPPGPRGATVAVELVNANGSALLAQGFRYHAPPTLSALAPPAGPAAGGTLVALSGTGFLQDGGSPAVILGGRPASALAVASDTLLTCRTPPGTAGTTVDVALVDESGSAELAGGFRYFPAPEIAALAPANGPAGGGTLITLHGSGFRNDVVGPNAVRFGTLQALRVTTVDDARVRVVVPPGPAGELVDLLIANSNGSHVLAGAYRYHAPPTVEELLPASGTALGGSSVTLSGSGFLVDGAGVNTVLFGAAQAAEVAVLDDRTLRFTVPPGAPGSSVDVTIANANGSALAPQAFRYFPPPQLDGLLPPHGYSGASTPVELVGSGFLDNAPGPNEVLFGSERALGVVVLGDTTLRCLAPPGSSGPVAVRLSNANGTSLLAEGFYYDWSPTVTGLEPGAGTPLGGVEVRLDGAGFLTPDAGSPRVRFGANEATNVRVLDERTLFCTAPAGPAGSSVSVVLANAHGDAEPSIFRYHAAPSLTSVDPVRGPPTGGTLVTLYGSGFLANDAGAPQVLFAGRAASDVAVLDDGALRCRSPAGPSRSLATVSVSNGNGSAQMQDAFLYRSALASDLNDDGIADAVLSGAEVVYVFFGAELLSDASTGAADLVLRPTQAGTDFGVQVDFADVNADGFADLVVGAPLADAGGTDAGAAFVFFGPLAASATPLLSSSAQVALRGQSAGDRFGSSLALGDVTGDGLADLLIGAPQSDLGGEDSGTGYLFRGGAGLASGPASGADARFTGAAAGDGFALGLAVGDVDGDGSGDLLAGAPLRNASGNAAGAAYVFRGGASLASASASAAAVQLAGDHAGDRFGTCLGAADLDGDGSDELVVAAPEGDGGGNGSGSVFLFRGGAGLRSGSAMNAQAVLDGEAGGNRLGTALAFGDVDGDGLPDLLVGAPRHDLPASNAGRAYLILGGALASGPVHAVAESILTAENSAFDLFGSAVSVVDLDGDGRADCLVGAPSSNAGGQDSGRVYAFLGAVLGATRSAAADDATFTGALQLLLVGKEIAGVR